MTPSAWEKSGFFLDWRGMRVFCRDQMPQDATLAADSAPTIVLIHGFPTSSWDWQDIWPALNRRYRVVAMDLLGFGFSDKPAGFNYRIEQQTDLVDDVLKQLNIRRAITVVHDYGVSLGQEILHRQITDTAARPWHAQGMLFLNGGLFPETHRARFIQKLLISRAGWLIARLGNERTFHRSFSAVFGANTQPSDVMLGHFWAIVARQNGQHNFHRLIRYMEDRRRRREDWLAALRNSPVPVRLINGLDDPVSGAHMVARYRELLGSVDCVELPGIGHYPQCEAPAAVATGILQWADRLA
jgi:pimeloyl-ACP methyl ester carboxylesterase